MKTHPSIVSDSVHIFVLLETVNQADSCQQESVADDKMPADHQYRQNDRSSQQENNKKFRKTNWQA